MTIAVLGIDALGVRWLKIENIGMLNTCSIYLTY
jgi:hypothetical protein